MWVFEEAAEFIAYLAEDAEPVVVDEEAAGLFYALGTEVAEVANSIIRGFQAIAEEGEEAIQNVVTQFVGL